MAEFPKMLYHPEKAALGRVFKTPEEIEEEKAFWGYGWQETPHADGWRHKDSPTDSDMPITKSTKKVR